MEIELTRIDLVAVVAGESTAAERERAARIAAPEARRRFVATRAAVRAVLAGRLGVPALKLAIMPGRGGKPAVAGLEFSLSHSGDHLVIAIASEPVGVDIETRRPAAPERLARRFFPAADADRVAAARDPAEEFRRQWVAREAALKVTGAGLSGGLEGALCEVADGAIVAVRTREGDFAVAEFCLPDGTPGAVAWARGNEAKLIWRSFSGLS